MTQHINIKPFYNSCILLFERGLLHDSFYFNPLSPKIDFYVDLLICETSWASNHKFMLLSKIFQETYYL